MGKLKGFKARQADSLVKRAAGALIWLRKQAGGESKFITWAELYSELTGQSIDDVNPEDVLRRLRQKSYYVKAFMRESGYGWSYHPSDRGLIRATAPGEDSAMHCAPYYQRRAVRASENFVDWTEKTVGDISRIPRTKQNQVSLASLAVSLPKHRAIMATLGMVVGIEKRKPAKQSPAKSKVAKAA